MLNTILGSFSTAGAATSYESIATVTVGAGGSSSISFTSIPGTYAHLQIRGIARSTRVNSTSYIKIQFNSDNGNNYANHGLYGDGSSAIAYGFASINDGGEAFISGSTSTASIFGASVWDILDYANTNKYKTTRALTGADLNGSGQLRFSSGLWQSTSAITTVTLLDGNGANFEQYSSFALYGIKGA